jgi:DinB superfamily
VLSKFEIRIQHISATVYVMTETTREILWLQFGASIDMLENAIVACPDDVWGDQFEFSAFWYITYHTLFYLDYYASESPDGFAPPAPYTLSEFDPAGVFPDRVYLKAEMLDYLEFAREKVRLLIFGLTPETMALRFVNEYRNYSRLEILLYNMRHVQHHAAQLNLLIRQHGSDAPNWVSRTKHDLER